MYNQLPSVVVRDATAFDIMVADVYTAWEKFKTDPSDNSQYREDDLASIINSTKGE